MSDPRESSQHPVLASVATTDAQRADALAYLKRCDALDLADMLFAELDTEHRVRTKTAVVRR